MPQAQNDRRPLPLLCRSAARSGFTLVEILVVIGIIVMLVGISVYGFAQVSRHSKAQKTKAALEVCKALMAEYEATAGRDEARTLMTDKSLLWNNNANPPDANAAMPYDFVRPTRILLRTLLKAPNAKQILGRLPADSVQYSVTVIVLGKPSENLPIILDGFGKPIVYIPPQGLCNLNLAGSSITTSKALRADGKLHSIVSAADTWAHLPCFWASYGPDGKIQEGDDNQYSFEN